ncbi:helix-turn-helix domain-containing protein [Paralimibaculum aggregatum]|uniref:helix-turn-helix domain-containing protein n=1 Tax=Paralimibaculum aggregatum TaxID=3036245 RepID=UPI00332D10B7
MSGYVHLSPSKRDRIADLRASGRSLRAIAGALGRSSSTISHELRRTACARGAYRPRIADGSYLLRRQRAAVLEPDAVLAGYVTGRLAEGWTPAPPGRRSAASPKGTGRGVAAGVKTRGGRTARAARAAVSRAEPSPDRVRWATCPRAAGAGPGAPGSRRVSELRWRAVAGALAGEGRRAVRRGVIGGRFRGVGSSMRTRMKTKKGSTVASVPWALKRGKPDEG